MKRQDIISIITKAPSLLRELISEIPENMLKEKRRPGKWSIHENACHLAEVHPMMIERFRRFKSEKKPEFKPYLPGSDTTPDDNLIDLDLAECLQRFEKDRAVLLSIVSTFSEGNWLNEAQHPEYIKFTAEIFLRHIMMHDQLHMYRIEELWLTRDEFI
jgi:uncharacterized damage-inducible protein DinB